MRPQPYDPNLTGPLNQVRLAAGTLNLTTSTAVAACIHLALGLALVKTTAPRVDKRSAAM
jgi:hypothetical protein